MKAGVKEMKKEYKKVNIDKIEDLQVNLVIISNHLGKRFSTW